MVDMRVKVGRRPRGRSPWIALLALAFAACASAGRPHSFAPDPPIAFPDPRAPLPASSEAWVDETLAELDLAGRAAQLVMVWMSGGYASVTDP
ncbi:MAG: hypothetical protein R3266_09480, partial [Gemmatimonadota bacterium]|nr:hypothetical protein [Gemmatimonadota bacterium]